MNKSSGDPDNGIKENASDELLLLLTLYEPALLPHAKALVEAERTIGQFVISQLSEWAFENDAIQESYVKFAGEIENLVRELDQAYENFIKSLAIRFEEYRLA